MLFELIFSFFATVFFAYLFNAPRKSIFVTGLNGAMGWLIFSYFNHFYKADILGCFVGAFIVALLSELAARHFKMPVTIFLTTGIIPLVPGAGLYNTMIELVQNNYEGAFKIGTQTIFMSGAIALAIAVNSSIFKIRIKILK